MITRIGEHKVKCGNLMDGIDDLMEGQRADLVYSDPPWGEGNLRYWETMRLKMTGATERRDNPLEPFLNKLFATINDYAANVVFIEYGIKWKDYLLEMADQYGLKNNVTINTRYRSGSKFLPMHLHVLSKTPVAIPDGMVADVTDTYGFDTLARSVKHFSVPNGILLDPCCGLGYSAKAAVAFNMKFRGNELNQVRLDKTIQRLKG